jgi:dTDP-4-dehydrorhamnose reductase
MVIRTSIIGEDKFSNKSLFSWVKSSKGKTIEGYTNHFWNGITAKQYGRLCKKIILNDLHTEGAFHVFSPEKITKFDLINLINKEFDFKIGVLPKEDDKKIDRSLSTIEGLNKILGIPPIQKQLMDLHSGK